MVATKYFLVFVLTTFILCCTNCCGAEEKEIKLSPDSDDAPPPPDMEAIMAMCNETFRISMEYLEELNTTGAFPDETDKTPMCYIRCYLEQLGLIKEDELDRDKAIEMAWSTSDESLDECNTEASEQTNPCEKAYFLTRCVMMRNIVSTRTTSNQAKK